MKALVDAPGSSDVRARTMRPATCVRRYLSMMAALGLATMLCTLWLPNRNATHATAAGTDHDEAFAVAASEL